MTRKSLFRILRLGLSLGVLAGALGCAKEREPVVRVQPNALDKSFFVGQLADKTDDPEFYWRGYVVDGSATQSQIGVGSWSHIDRIRWQITENQLIARKSYAMFDDSTFQKEYSGPDSAGIVVASYKISSHFDIRRAYNPSTGEEQNIIEENTTDRPWYERQYMRVDWSTNTVEDPMWFDMFLGKAFGEIKVSPLVYNVTDPTKDDAPHFEPEDGYFDVTNRYYLESANTTIWGFQIPACYIVSIFTGAATYECDPQEATVRFSYWKVDPNHDFERLENSKASMDIVGNPGGLGDSFEIGVVTAPRMGFDPSYGFTDKNYHRFANIHNIWRRSHQQTACDAKGDSDNNGTDDQCENSVTGYGGNEGSQCDVFDKKCTIPYRDRQIKPISYWVNDLMPTEFLGPAQDVMYAWNQMYKPAVAYAREVECRRTGGSRADCHNQFFTGDKEMVRMGGWLVETTSDSNDVIVMCHNPVEVGDLHELDDGTKICGPTGSTARTGDLRKHMMVYWPYDSRAPWGGIANWNGDPLTGEIIGGAALVMGRSVRYGAAFARDVLQVAMGDMTMEQIMEGVPQGTYFTPSLSYRAPSSGKALSEKEIQSRVRAVDATNAMQTLGIKPLAGSSMAEKLASFSALKAGQFYDATSEAAAVSRFDSMVQPMLGTSMETQLMGGNWVVNNLGIDPGSSASSEVVNMASPLRLLDAGKRRILHDSIRTRLEARGACFLDSEAPMVGSVDIPGLAARFKQLYKNDDAKTRGEKIYQDLLPETFKGIQLHEVGHSLGMLHQFASSWDSPNFMPQYWQLRTNEGATAGSCNGQVRPDSTDPSKPDTCMGPRYLDGETLDEMGLGDESRPGISYYASTSTMEYQWERFGESSGLGPYDYFTIKALYGRVLETHDGISVSEQESFGPRMRSQLNEQDMILRPDDPISPGDGARPVHYTELARRMKVFDAGRDCRPATQEEKDVAKWLIVHGKVCSPPPKDHAAWQDFLSNQSDPTDPNSQAPYWHTDKNNERKGGGSVRWFYRWGSTNNSYMQSNPSDAGADPYEVAVNTRLKFEVMYPFAYFRRRNREWNWWNIPNAVAETYYDRERSFHWHAATRSALFMRSFGETAYNQMAENDDWLRPYLMASTEAFNLLYRSIVMPQPGVYTLYNDDVESRYVYGWQKAYIADTSDSTIEPDKALFTIPMGEGRFIDMDMDSSPAGGGSWNYSNWIKRYGFETEKAYAMYMLTDGRPPVYTPSRDLFLDPRNQSVNFYADMPHAMDRLIAGLMSEDWDTIGMQASGDDGKNLTMLKLYDITPKTTSPREGDHVLFPNVGYEQQFLASYFAAWLSRETGDMTLLNKMRIWIEGVDGNIGGDAFPDQSVQVRFSNPWSGFTYIARKYGSEEVAGKMVDKGTGARMLQYANWLFSVAYKVQKSNGVPVFDQYGQVQPILGPDGLPQVVGLDGPSVRARTRLIRYIGMIDGTRQIGLYWGGGPL